MLRRPLRAIDLVVRDAQIVPRDPHHRTLGPQRLVLKRPLHKEIALRRREIFQALDVRATTACGTVVVVAPLLIQAVHLLRAGELAVALHGVVLEGDGHVAVERGEVLAEEELVDDGEAEDDNHDDGLGLAGGVAGGVAVGVGVGDEEEEADQAGLHEVQADEELVDGGGKEQAAGVGAEFGDVEGVVAVGDPEETEGDDVEDEDERGDDSIDEACNVG